MCILKESKNIPIRTVAKKAMPIKTTYKLPPSIVEGLGFNNK